MTFDLGSTFLEQLPSLCSVCEGGHEKSFLFFRNSFSFSFPFSCLMCSLNETTVECSAVWPKDVSWNRNFSHQVQAMKPLKMK